jgi:plastocyanin
MAQTWMILINQTDPHFNVDAYGYHSGEPLRAQLGDLVSWNNQTDDVHEITIYTSDNKPGFVREVAAGKVSSPGYVVDAADMKVREKENVSGVIEYRATDWDWRSSITVVKS